MTGPDVPLAIGLADMNEVDISVGILEGVAAASGAPRGPSWAPGIFTPPDSVGRSRLHLDVASRSLFLVRRGGDAVATFTLLESDPMYWPAAGDEALYLHRFAVRSDAAGVGRHAIEWMVGEVLRRGRDYLRLDCLADNPGIVRYYERRGFNAVDEVVRDGVRYSLRELPVAGTVSLRTSR